MKNTRIKEEKLTQQLPFMERILYVTSTDKKISVILEETMLGVIMPKFTIRDFPYTNKVNTYDKNLKRIKEYFNFK